MASCGDPEEDAQVVQLRKQLAEAEEAHKAALGQVTNAQWAYAETERDLTAMRRRAETAEAKLAAVPVEAMRKISNRAEWFWPPTPEYKALADWISTLPPEGMEVNA